MFSFIIHSAWLAIQAFIGFSILLPVVFYVAYCIYKLTKKQPQADEELHEEKDYAIIVSVHGKAERWQPLLHSLLQLNYTNYLVYVVVNNNHLANLHFNKDRVVVLRTAKECNSAIRLHRFAIENFNRPHTHVVILDSASLVNKEYLNHLNVCFHQGYQAAQSMNTIKNSHLIYDLIRSVGNVYSSFFAGELPFTLGSSAVLANTGAAFTVRLYKQCLKEIKVTDTNFIKTVQKIIINRGYQIAFAQNAVVYDGRTAHKKQLMQHHASNINTWLSKFTSYCKLIGKGVSTGNINQFLSGVLLLQPPLLTNLIAAVFCFFINLWMSPETAMIWAGCLLLFPLYILMATVHSKNHYDTQETIMAGTDNDSFFQTISLYEAGREDYDMAAQTV